MVATRGQIPKRSETRIRRNLPEDGLEISRVPGAEYVTMPEPDEEWADIAYEMYLSVAESGQVRFFEPSDWMMLYMTCDQISRQLHKQFIGFRDMGRGQQEATYGYKPMNGSELTAIFKILGSLGVTEGDRRRMRIELTRGEPAAPEVTAGQTAVTNARGALGLIQGGKAAQ